MALGMTTFMAPRFAPGDSTPLRVGEVFSLEPMLVHHGVGTACIENTVLITETGARVLSKASELLAGIPFASELVASFTVCHYTTGCGFSAFAD